MVEFFISQWLCKKQLSSLQNAFEEKLYKYFLCLVYQWRITRHIQAKEGFWASGQCFSFQLSASPSAVFTENWSAENKCNAIPLIFMECKRWELLILRQVKPALCPHPRAEDHVTALWNNQTCLWQAVYRDVRLPSIFIAYITNLWHGKLAQPAVLLCWSQLDGAHGVAAMRKVSSGISLRASSPDAGIPHNLGTLSQNEKAGPGGTGWRREVRVNCISATVWAQILTQPRWLSRAGLRGRNRLGLCVWAIYSYLAAWKEHSTDSLGRSPVVGETWQFGSSFSSDK